MLGLSQNTTRYRDLAKSGSAGCPLGRRIVKRSRFGPFRKQRYRDQTSARAIVGESAVSVVRESVCMKDSRRWPNWRRRQPAQTTAIAGAAGGGGGGRGTAVVALSP